MELIDLAAIKNLNAVQDLNAVQGIEDMRDTCMEIVELCPNLPLANAYVPFQKYSKIYPMNEGLVRGTIFPDLDMPYKKVDPKCRPIKMC